MKYQQLDRSLSLAKYSYKHSKDKGQERLYAEEVRNEIQIILNNLR